MSILYKFPCIRYQIKYLTVPKVYVLKVLPTDVTHSYNGERGWGVGRKGEKLEK